VIKINKFNLLVSSPRFRERDASAEIMYFLTNIGIDDVKAKPLGITGLIGVDINIDPIIAIRKLRKYINDNLVYVQFIFKITPLEILVNSTIDNIIDGVNKLKHKIGSNETFRITLERRHTYIDRNELIQEVADVIDNKVNLNYPDKIILIEIIGDRTGISIIEQDDIISVPIMRKLAGFENYENLF